MSRLRGIPRRTQAAIDVAFERPVRPPRWKSGTLALALGITPWALLLGGCLTFSSVQPATPEESLGAIPTISDAAVRVRITTAERRDGASSATTPSADVREAIADSLRSAFPHASEAPNADARYTLDLEVTYEALGSKLSVILCVCTATVIPGVLGESYTTKATLRDSKGHALGSSQARGTWRMVHWFPTNVAGVLLWSDIHFGPRGRPLGNSLKACLVALSRLRICGVVPSGVAPKAAPAGTGPPESGH